MSGPVVQVYCLGDVMVDVGAVLSGPLANGSDTPAEIRTRQGGSAANTAAWLADLGVPTALIGRVGDDDAGRTARAALAAAGVVDLLTTDPDRPTGTCLVLVGADGERTMVPDGGANRGLTMRDLPVNVFGPQTHLHVSGYSLFAEKVRPVALEALRLAATAGAGVSVGAASAAPLAAVGAEAFLSWLPVPATLFANAAEARVLTRAKDVDVLLDRLAGRAREVVLTLGAEGAVAARGAGRWTGAVSGDVTVVDTTGGGDAFAAGYLAERLAGAEPDVALAAGHRAAGRCVGLLGGRPA